MEPMTTKNDSTNVLEYGEVTQHDGYTLQDAGTIKLGRTKYTVEIQNVDNCESTTWLKGPRGAAYILQPVNMLKDDGVRRIISFGSGAPLRVKGNEVRIVILGDIVEVYER